MSGTTQQNNVYIITPEDRMQFYQYCQDNVFTANVFTAPGISYKYVHWFLIPAVLIVVLFSFLERRKLIKHDFLGGRPAPIRPLSFLDEPNNRWGITVAFGATTGSFIKVTQKTFSLEFPIWAKIFLVYVLCLETSVICFPIFACMTSRHKLVGAITGLVYSAGWFIFEMFINVQVGRCYDEFTDLPIVKSKINMPAHYLIQEFPIMLCDLLILLKFGHKLYKCISKGVYKTTSEERNRICRSFHIKYIKHLLRKSHGEEQCIKLKDKFISRFVKPVPGFRYPISILVTVFMSCMLLYIFGLYCALVMEVGSTYLKEYVELWTAANVVATIVTVLCGIKNIYNFAINYRRDMLSLYRGDRSFIPSTVTSPLPNVYMARGMRFIGTAIVGTLWGTVFCYLIVFVPMVLTLLVFRYLRDNDKLPRLYEQCQWMIYPVCMILIFQLQMILIGRFFVQPATNANDKKRPLAVDNRNLYDIVSFFMLFVNASIGLFTFLKRILIGTLMGLFLIPRMDRSLLMSGYESMDKCYVNYIGMIMVDFAHNNPTMRVFCHLIKECAESRRDMTPLQTAVDNAIYGDGAMTIPQERENNVSKRRWWLAYTLIRNPSLVSHRRRNRNMTDVEDIDYSIEQEAPTDTTGSFIFRCWKKCTCTVPPNISTNIMATLVLLMFALLYAGIPLLLEDLKHKL